MMMWLFITIELLMKVADFYLGGKSYSHCANYTLLYSVLNSVIIFSAAMVAFCFSNEGGWVQSFNKSVHYWLSITDKTSHSQS